MLDATRTVVRTSRLLWLVVALALVAAACGGDQAADEPAADTMAQDDMGHDDMNDMGEAMDDEAMDDEAMAQHEAGDHAHEDLTYPPVEGADEVTITMVDLAFEPDGLSLTAGEPVNLRVVNEGALFHDLTLDEPALHVNVDPGETEITSLVIDEPGTYEATCTVEGHADAGMVLTIEVD